MDNLSYSQIWKGNEYLHSKLSKDKLIGCLDTSKLNNGDILCIFFINSSGDNACATFSTFFHHHKFFSTVVTAVPEYIYSVVFRMDSSGNFYCESISNNKSDDYGIHIFEITKFSTNVVHFS